ncbi:phosphoribosylformylglycinamidine cyclo-ligase [Candidatus Cetobacterium colombiensis]|uniref:Phosphoribosylformylglycinamidine cyclo-ligase n=1 Tax=Candidatus Cetobacterium colombiensis TaxID=3073100 RepID=A0ABU4WCQ9_9FUSO|nr:phosphoribosylformylglycinamidine cyclo-ligase [Candidatus Cetobacterium colombiensis]MDX8337307.1 phosphoribosylformylglycinamidine cyclo-ligase [Candidatus Cetobacterium colombiensis]
MSNKYMEAGVSLEAGYESVRRIKSHVERTKVKGAINSLGAFGGMFDLSELGMKEPVLVSGTDGVGTKLMLAFEMDKHDTIGQDVVAMCVNDVLVQGAMPLYFLDYIAVGKNYPEQIESIVKGVADGCVAAECALIGGETAEMPGMYSEGHYDIAGFTVGAVEKKELITGSEIGEGDVLIGISSSGVHSNGFSLVRKIIKDANLDLKKVYEGFEKTLGEELLTPTKIYVKTVKEILKKVKIKGMCHITGGGFYENIPRIIPEGLGVEIEIKNINELKIFKFLEAVGGVPKKEMFNVFNMGVGFIFVVSKSEVEILVKELKKIDETAMILGEVTKKSGVEIKW